MIIRFEMSPYQAEEEISFRLKSKDSDSLDRSPAKKERALFQESITPFSSRCNKAPLTTRKFFMAMAC